MKIVKSLASMQRLGLRLPHPIVLVPTMGALHDGHIALVCRAKRRAGKTGTTVASIFVNPAQFGPNEDFAKYPRRFAADCALLGQAGCDVVFAPEADDMYFADRSVSVTETSLTSVMCGVSRPGHFAGVCTVVSKLFNLTRPDIAIFGEKDFQQLAIIRRMVRDLNFPVQIVSHPTIREPDGLALSSRNRYLTPEERQQAPIIYRTLLRAGQKIRNGARYTKQLENWIRTEISSAPTARIDYVVAVDPVTLQSRKTLDKPVLLAAAVFFGSTRLIDNRLVR
jgi:pantoate--beta-alanine ligase